MTRRIEFTLLVVELLVEMKCCDFGMMPFDVAEVEVIGLRLVISWYSKSIRQVESSERVSHL